jgi:hypothetical protein
MRLDKETFPSGSQLLRAEHAYVVTFMLFKPSNSLNTQADGSVGSKGVSVDMVACHAK